MDVLQITLPLFTLVLLGFIATRSGYLTLNDNGAIGRVVIRICMPALVFHSVTTAPLEDTLNPVFLTAYGGASLLVFALGFLRARYLGGVPAGDSALYGLGASASNSGFMGYPIAFTVIGAGAGPLLAQCIIVENLLMVPLTIAIADGSGAGGLRASLRPVVKGFLRNPLVIGVAVGLAFAILRLPVPGLLAGAADTLAGVAAPLALFVIGGSLAGISISGLTPQMGWIVGGKLVAHPLAVLAALSLMPGVESWMLMGGLLFAAMPMMSIYPIVGARLGRSGFCASALLMTLILSFVTVNVLMWMVT